MDGQHDIHHISALHELNRRVAACTGDRIDGGDELGGFDGQHGAVVGFYSTADRQGAVCDGELRKCNAVNGFRGREHKSNVQRVCVNIGREDDGVMDAGGFSDIQRIRIGKLCAAVGFRKRHVIAIYLAAGDGVEEQIILQIERLIAGVFDIRGAV